MKNTNPKDAVGIAKVPTSTVPSKVVLELGLAMLEGARKYGRHNYRVSGVRASAYYDAAMRHLKLFWEGQDTDPDSGLHHLVKAMACEAVLRDSQHMGNWIDDRPPNLPGGLGIEELNAKAAEIIARYPEAKEPFTEVNHSTGTGTKKTTTPDGTELKFETTLSTKDKSVYAASNGADKKPYSTCNECEHYEGTPAVGVSKPCCLFGRYPGYTAHPYCFHLKGTKC